MPCCVCDMTGVVCDMDSVFEELAPLNDAGIDTKGRLLISDRAQLLLGYHKIIDGLTEAQRKGKGLGTTKKGEFRVGGDGKRFFLHHLCHVDLTFLLSPCFVPGIGPAYSAKAMRSVALRVGQLRHFDSFKTELRAAVEAHQRMFEFDYDVEAEIEKCVREFGNVVGCFVSPTVEWWLRGWLCACVLGSCVQDGRVPRSPDV